MSLSGILDLPATCYGGIHGDRRCRCCVEPQKI